MVGKGWCFYYTITKFHHPNLASFVVDGAAVKTRFWGRMGPQGWGRMGPGPLCPTHGGPFCPTPGLNFLKKNWKIFLIFFEKILRKKNSKIFQNWKNKENLGRGRMGPLLRGAHFAPWEGTHSAPWRDPYDLHAGQMGPSLSFFLYLPFLLDLSIYEVCGLTFYNTSWRQSPTMISFTQL